MIRIILNGKKATYDSVRSAIASLRKERDDVDVRVTYEYGDVERFVNEAVHENVQRLIVGGGDGSVNEIVDAMAKLPRDERPELAILPLGTAGFGAQVTAETPVALKNFLGGGAYTLTDVIKALNFTPYVGKLKAPNFDSEETGIVAAICNGRQAGVGQVLAPKAFINDGLLDVVLVREVLHADIATLLDEMNDPTHDGEYIKYFQTPWLECEAEQIIPVNLDGEPYENKNIRFEIVPNAIDLVLPVSCPCIK